MNLSATTGKSGKTPKGEGADLMQRKSLGLVAIIAIPGLFFGLVFSVLLLLLVTPLAPAARHPACVRACRPFSDVTDDPGVNGSPAFVRGCLPRPLPRRPAADHRLTARLC